VRVILLENGTARILLAPAWQCCGNAAARVAHAWREREREREREKYVYARANIAASGIVKQVGGCAANSIAIKSFDLFRMLPGEGGGERERRGCGTGV